jgi:uncharacterized protein DUF3352
MSHVSLQSSGLQAGLRYFALAHRLRGAVWEDVRHRLRRGSASRPSLTARFGGRPSPTARRRRPTPAVAFALAAALVLAACGSGSGSGGSADPAAAVPPNVPFYAEVVLRPQGDAREGALAAAGKILHTSDPQARIRSLIQQAAASDGTKVDFAKDIEPWLGDKAGLWVALPARGSGSTPGVGVAVAVRDADQARKSIDGLAARNGTKLAARTSGGHEYEVAPDGTAVAVEGDYALLGMESEVRRGLATLDGDGGGSGDDRGSGAKDLAEQDGYRRAIEPLEDNRLAHYYLDLKTLFDAALRADPSATSQLGPFQGMLSGMLAGTPQVGSFSADGDRLTLETVMRGGGGMFGQLFALTGLGASPLLEKLPGDAWGVAAVPKVGATAEKLLSGFGGAFGGVALREQLRQQVGIDLDQDLFSWMGDAGLFVRGTTESAVDGGVVVEATDESKAASAFGKLVGLARTRGHLDPQPIRVAGADTAFSIARPLSGGHGSSGAKPPFVLARGNGRVVATFGQAAAAAALSPDRTFGDSDTMDQARDALDGKADPAIVVALAPVLALAESSGSASDPDYQKAKPYLQAFDVIAAGSRKDGDTVRSRIAAGLR